jgi:hypothetical protein
VLCQFFARPKQLLRLYNMFHDPGYPVLCFDECPHDIKHLTDALITMFEPVGGVLWDNSWQAVLIVSSNAS